MNPQRYYAERIPDSYYAIYRMRDGSTRMVYIASEVERRIFDTDPLVACVLNTARTKEWAKVLMKHYGVETCATA